jgi:predicted NAD-dependent protein-ADP-ribosyltransferase YbiA (DUF1768 family)
MVVSKINKSVSYPEIKTIDLKDIDEDSNMYEIEIFEMNIIIAVGNSHIKQDDKSIMYFPIYFIKKNNKSVQIGVYEIPAKNITRITDEDGNLMVEEMNEPLIYSSFVNKSFIEKNRLIEKEHKSSAASSSQKEKETELVVIPEKRRDLFRIIPDFPVPNKLMEETEQEAKDITEKYHTDSRHLWIQKFMKNKNYSIKDNEGNGDCFFAMVRDAYRSIGQETSVGKIRERLSESATEETYKMYKENYTMYYLAIEKDNDTLLEIKKQIEDVRKKLKNTISTSEKNELQTYEKQLKAQFEKIKSEQAISKEELKEFKFMKNVNSLEDFRKKIRLCEFWADAWAIDILEKSLNVKFIILSSESYENNDGINILKCGHNNTTFQENSNQDFTPEFYIITEHTGNHYKLIGYKDKMIFTYSEIPFYIKKMIVDKCMETTGGIFNIIPEFKQLKRRMVRGDGINSPENKIYSPEIEIELDDEGDDKDDGTTPSYKSSSSSSKISQAEIQNLFDNEIVFVIHPKIGKNLAPGKANGDELPASKKREYVELTKMSEWRNKLTDFWKQEFILDGHRWISVETYVQASRYKSNNREFYITFSLDSVNNTKISRDPELAKTVSESKSGLVKGEQLRPKNVKPDPEFEKRKNKEEYDAIFAKFNQNVDLKNVLLATKDAKLVFYVKGDKPIPCDNLMIVRSLL